MSLRPDPPEIVLSAAWHGGAVPATLVTIDGVPLEIVHRGTWSHGLGPDFNDALIEGQVNIEVVIPSDGGTVGPYVSIINKWAPHPFNARLMRNFILSEEGQLIYAKGYATPILPNIELPAELAEKRPPAEAYAATTPISDWAAAVASFQLIADTWGNEVLGQ